MAKNKLSPETLDTLRPLERHLRDAVRAGDTERAVESAAQIQMLFGSDRRHPRLLQAKLWAFEACLDAQRLMYAEKGFIGIRKLASSRTRIYLEASSLLAVCYLRQNKIGEAKRLIRDVIDSINHIESPRTRHVFQRRLIERIEEECVFVGLIGSNAGDMDPGEIHAKAVLLIQTNSDSEILRLIGSSVPAASVHLLTEVRTYSIQQLPKPDQKLLASAQSSASSNHIGKTTFAMLRRVAWKTLCNPDSSLYKLWSKRVPQVFGPGYFTAAIVSAMSDLRIGVPLLASGIVALVMKYSAEEFCALAKPKGIMMDRKESQE